jgi:hypothetical protein
MRDDHGTDGRVASATAGAAASVAGSVAPWNKPNGKVAGLASARAEGISRRTLASAAGLPPARVHQITAAADTDELDAALGGLRAAGWPARKTPTEMTTPSWTAASGVRVPLAPLRGLHISPVSMFTFGSDTPVACRWPSDGRRVAAGFGLVMLAAVVGVQAAARAAEVVGGGCLRRVVRAGRPPAWAGRH